MTINGIRLRKARHLTWRWGIPAIDKDLSGLPIDPTRKVFCLKGEDMPEAQDEHGRTMWNPSDLKALPQSHTEPDWAYGPWRKQKRRRLIEGREVYEYYTRPVYHALGTEVYYGTIYTLEQ